jgi:hypothetical protein
VLGDLARAVVQGEWQYRATTDEVTIRAWWRQRPASNVWTLEGTHAARKLGGDTLPTRAKHTFVVVKLRVRASRTVMLDPFEFVHLLVGSTEYRYSQPGYAAINASTGDRLFFDDTLRAGRVVHGQVVFDVPLSEHMALVVDNGQRIALEGVQ